MFPEWFRPQVGRDALRELVAARVALDALEVELVATLRGQGCTWLELSDILGLTPQGAAKRHRATAGRRLHYDAGAEPFIPAERGG